MADSTPSALFQHAEQLLGSGDYDASARASQRAFQAAFDAGERELAVRCAIAAAKAYFNTERMEEAMQWLQKVRSIDQSGEWPGMLATAWVMMSSVYGAQNRVREALETLQHGLRFLDDSVNSRDKCVCFTGSGILYENLGMPNSAYQSYQQAMQYAADSPDVTHRFRMRRNLLEGALLLYEHHLPHCPAEAKAIMQENLQHVALLQFESTQIKTPFAIASACYMAGRFYLMRGEAEQALGSIAGAMNHYAVVNRIFKLELLAVKGRALHALGRAEEAKATAALANDYLPHDPQTMLLGDLRRCCTMAELSGDFERAYHLVQILHARVMANAHAFVDAKVSEAAAQLTNRTMQVELDELRSRNENLAGTQQHLAKLVNSDPGTGLSNRRALELSFNEAQESGKPTCLMMIDVDHFKQVNDDFNHITGDQVLRRIATVLQGLVQDQDCVARFGGEEFAILIHDADIHGGRQLAQRIQRELSTIDWSDLVPGRSITVSGGAVEVSQGAVLEDVLKNADILLYQAKREGRNRIFLGQIETPLDPIQAPSAIDLTISPAKLLDMPQAAVTPQA